MNAALLDALRTALDPGAVLAGDEVAGRTAGFMREDKLQACVLVRPNSTQQVAEVLRLCHAAPQPVVTHGGLTGLVHGADATPAELVLSLERMNAIEEVDPLQRIAVVQAGVSLQALQEAADARDLSFPLDLGARGSATLGGNASTNAGGNRVIRYGMMREMVLGIEAVLADGTVVSSLNRMIKNNAGYDLKQLFIGTEGTLGVVTRLVLRLREKPRSQDVALVAVAEFGKLAGLLRHMDRALGGGLTAFEAMWREFYELTTSPPALSRPAVPHGHAYYVLVESMGADAARDAERFSAALESAWQAGLVADAAVAGSDRERAAMWGIRDDVMQMLRDGMPFTFDVSLPVHAMEEFVREVRAALAARWPEHRCWVFGHLGDGNLHLVIRAGAPDAATRGEVERMVYGPLAAIGGSVSAEHGIGLEKKAYLGISRSPQEIELMRTLKRSLDPRDILNRGKIF